MAWNFFWGFAGFAMMFGLARLAMIWTVGHEEWGHGFSVPQ
jgi:hypothetical protein